MAKVLTMELSRKSIEAVIKQIDAYKNSLDQKCATLAQRVANRISWNAQTGFATALADDIVGAPKPSNVSVTVEDNGNVQFVVASGSDVAFIEFGAGIHYNGSAGNSPNPWGANLGFTIGSYGQGKGGRSHAWGFFDADGNLHISHGTPAAMPMYHGVQEAVQVLFDLAREVFSA